MTSPHLFGLVIGDFAFLRLDTPRHNETLTLMFGSSDCALSVDSQVLPSSQQSSEFWIWMRGRDGACIPDQLKGLRLGYSLLPAFSGHSWGKGLVMKLRKICIDSKTLEGRVFSLYWHAPWTWCKVVHVHADVDGLHCPYYCHWVRQTVADSYDSCLLDFPESLQWVQSEFRCTVTTRWHTWLWMCIIVSLPTET